jgi:protein-S-isoprenylcysteine O-methyltransferase Ste14
MDTLSKPARALWLMPNLLLGGIPSFLFFVWVERNAALPWIPAELGWPWLELPAEAPLPATVAWNFSLFLLFGLVHSALAQARAHGWLARLFPLQTLRSVYVIVTGLTLVALMGLWQPTGRIVWLAPLPSLPLNVLSVALYWTILGKAYWLLLRFDGLQFLGLRQLFARARDVERSAGMPELVESGAYGRVRHPVYSLTLLAFIATPFMTLDRLILTLSVAAYLVPAIPLEERKLVALFGARYERYRERVPALFPRLR